jgi:gamma-glutamylcyclotransferase (GGCT)/AIG2-like uncharacterized protein YtfP
MATISVEGFPRAQHVFVYGTLVDPRRLDEVLGHRHAGERLRACLSGYERRSSPAFAYPFLVAQPHAKTDGVLVMDLSPEDIRTLDDFEEVDRGVYLRMDVDVEAWGCGPTPWRVAAQTYVAGPALLEQLAARSAERSTCG